MPAPITVYTTGYCGYCDAAKRLLRERGHVFHEVDVGADPSLRQRLARDNGGYRTVPMIFVGERFIGGHSDLVALDRTGELARLVKA